MYVTLLSDPKNLNTSEIILTMKQNQVHFFMLILHKLIIDTVQGSDQLFW